MPTAGVTVQDGTALLEVLHDNGPPGLIVLAPHGGRIEHLTDTQADLVRTTLEDLGVSSWTCRGFKPGAAPTTGGTSPPPISPRRWPERA